MTREDQLLHQSGTRRFFWTNSRSFSFASLGFSRRDRRLVELVYAFCRITDDIVDESDGQSAGEIGERLDEWLASARKAFDGGASGIDWLDELMRASAERGVPFEVIRTLVEGVRLDASLTRIDTVDELKSYCYGVASVVGVWLCYLFGVHDAPMLTRAEALGRAMQITNILRDVGEDVRRGRIYLPSEMLDHHGITAAQLERAAQTGEVPTGYDRLISEMIDLANQDYELAWEGIPRLPASFARASAVAAEVYRGIQKRIIANGYNNFTRRSRTGMLTKCRLLGQAMIKLGLRRFQPGGPFDQAVRLTAGAILLPFILAAPGQVSAQSSQREMDELRAYFRRAAQDEAFIDSATAKIEDLRAADASERLLQGYEGALTMIRAKYAFWPPRKLELVLNGVAVLDSLVADDPDDVEIRYLRLASCYFLPGFLHRQSSVDEDFQALSTLLLRPEGQPDTDQFKRIARFVLQNGDLSGEAYDKLYARLMEVQRGETVETASQ